MCGLRGRNHAAGEAKWSRPPDSARAAGRNLSIKHDSPAPAVQREPQAGDEENGGAAGRARRTRGEPAQFNVSFGVGGDGVAGAIVAGAGGEDGEMKIAA